MNDDRLKLQLEVMAAFLAGNQQYETYSTEDQQRIAVLHEKAKAAAYGVALTVLADLDGQRLVEGKTKMIEETAIYGVSPEPFADEDARVSPEPFADDADGLDWREQYLPHARRAFDKLLALDRELEQNTAEARARIAHLEEQLLAERVWVEEEEAKQTGQRRFYELQLRAYVEREAERTHVKTVTFPNGSFSLRAQQPQWVYPAKSEDEYVTLMAALEAAKLVRVVYEPDARAVKAKVTVSPTGSVYLPGQEEALPGVRVVEREDAFSYRAKERK